ncbi:MAG: FKBP-type peptidylprolyl isomerase [Acidobacteria bacterium]|nr:FKBP-type peptidylprolyl isomerase [Acidobacteriota bacterium]NIO58743.1 FKBP-type peptidylprolyl isomerase [Acidobacteriota bacterium]NIQ84517.1 FKBP-type peptidylprolyl isomerase [Acidobacteriota bacterium]
MSLLAALPAAAQSGSRPSTTQGFFPAPDDVAAPPEDARRTESGLAWRLLGEPAERENRPGLLDMVDVRYTGWATDGRLFDTTERDRKPRRLPVSGFIAGFEEAVLLLSEGESGRFWVPPELAYPKSALDKPQGMLVFDVTLVEIIRGPERPASLEPPEDAKRLDSGLAWVVLREGDPGGQPPGDEATVLVEYSSWSRSGDLYDSTKHRGEPRALTMDQMIEGLRRSFKTMVPGERRLVWIPPELATFSGQAAFEDTVVFDLELLSYMLPPVAPANISSIPDDAERSETGLAWKVTKAGTGTVRPAPGDRVKILYALWAQNQLFDSSYAHASPGTFTLDDRMPEGFNEGLFGMVAGERRFFWIPEELAYRGQKDRPPGLLVFEIELLSIESGGVGEAAETPLNAMPDE